MGPVCDLGGRGGTSALGVGGHGLDGVFVSEAEECWETTVLGGGHNACQGRRIDGGLGGMGGVSAH